MNQEIEFVCFCLAKRHPNEFRGRHLPSSCRLCNAPFDLNSIMPKAEAETKGLLSIPQESAPKAQPAPEPVSPPQPITAAPRPIQTAQPSLSAAQPPFPPVPRPIQTAPAAPWHTPPAARPVPGRMQPPAASIQLDYFCEKIDIPPEGGWLGRSGVGSQWFDGNLLISREHLYIKPLEDGRVQVGPDKSLNGSSITVGGEKKPLGCGETAILTHGDTLWLYNVPLQLERIQR